MHPLLWKWLGPIPITPRHFISSLVHIVRRLGTGGMVGSLALWTNTTRMWDTGVPFDMVRSLFQTASQAHSSKCTQRNSRNRTAKRDELSCHVQTRRLLEHHWPLPVGPCETRERGMPSRIGISRTCFACRRAQLPFWSHQEVWRLSAFKMDRAARAL
jgi:hypothetical protein